MDGQTHIREKSGSSSKWYILKFVFFSSLFFNRLDRKKVHYTFDDQTEMVEEYDAKTNVLLSMIHPFNSIESISSSFT